ncbi:MAG TPA: DUF1295 domain-containing protein [Treponemataceae bacterium]|nr:DUF1295 domain-containing protein [Treponemataceae bacterium]
MNRKKRDVLIVFLLYVVSIAVSIFVFILTKAFSTNQRLLLADLAAMVFIYTCSLLLRNASLYDPFWSVIPPVFLIIAFVSLNKTLNLTNFLLLFSISLWALRLTINWIKGWDGFTEVDWRYVMIRDKAPKLYFLTSFLAIQLFPTLIVFVQLLVGLRIIELGASLNVGFAIGFTMIIGATIIQYISDEQMRTFKIETKGKKKCIDTGLWKYSRHPNYFGEILVWWGLYLLYFSIVQHIDLYILAPLAMTFLFIFISIPMMEKKILGTRPEYTVYQKKVSMIIPFPRFTKKDTILD